MKQNKLVIAVLVVIAVLFVFGLSSGVFRDKEKNGGTMTMSKAQKYKKGWVASLDTIMSSMRPKFNMGRMIVPAECKKDSQTFRLTDKMAACTITIKREKGARVQKAVLSVETDNVTLRVSYPADQPCAPPDDASSTRGTPVSLKRLKKSKAQSNLFKINPGLIKGGATGVLQPLTLDVIYTPQGKNEQTRRCPVSGEIDLAVLEKGGSLRLECKGCNEDRSITAKIK